MFEKLVEVAEQSATRASRRQFLGRVGNGALVAAGALGGFLAFGSDAHAAKRNRRCTSDANCPRGYICEGGRCVKGIRPPQACGADSVASCVGKVVGQWCPAGTRSGVCRGAPYCICVVENGRR